MKSLCYVFRDVFFAVLVYKLAWKIDPLSLVLIENRALSPVVAFVVKWLSWASYWYLQGIILAAGGAWLTKRGMARFHHTTGLII